MKCDSPVDCRLVPAGRDQHIYFLPTGEKMQTNPFSSAMQYPYPPDWGVFAIENPPNFLYNGIIISIWEAIL